MTEQANKYDTEYSILETDDSTLKSEYIAVATSEPQPPPPGAPIGGLWGVQAYSGTKSNICGLIGVVSLVAVGFGVCPGDIDDRIVYWAEGIFYDEDGTVLVDTCGTLAPTVFTSPEIECIGR
mmetsp:Transcript_34066/g.40771  ORF Transcript_34066/g.40771 Transcript_34066/m.40771 type:complete len:123 (+) Transcript_34066:134-502(+)|eukprot:CAMPEP_0198254550 /NCGR_PEP_ID=MMETSP1447-20131203/4837_1 /TAXON_ID=420782 /ORGANISM="Chaetoceros dichaeta, Strain CCMP1751" /LENGTH=122 /DNA_ID=CAMNT_0043940641 /DNA_START=119 /DNA_END=487 /DNA_ORIENTATION=-